MKKRALIIISLLLVCTMFLTGCGSEKTKKMVCTRVIDQNGIKMDLRYEATYTGDVVSLLESTEKVISSDTAVLEQYQTLLKQSYAPYDNVKYYNVDITIDGDTLTSHVVVNADKIDHLLAQEANTTQFQSEVSFVGSLYNEEHNLFDRLADINDYTSGYLHAIMEAQLKIQGLKVSIEKQDTSTKINDDEIENIIDQSIKPGEEVDKGTEIILYIPNVKKYYPDMVGESWSLPEARIFATDNKIKLEVIYRETDSYDPGVIIKQSKTSSDELKSGDTLIVTVAKEKKTTSSSTNNNQTTNSNNDNTTNNTNTSKPVENEDGNDETKEKTD